mgnify:CR=1 FL=1
MIAQDKNRCAYQEFTLTNVTCKKTANFNLMSMGAMLMNGWESRGTADMIVLTKEKITIKFDIVVKTKRGAVFCATLVPRNKKDATEVEVVNTTKEGVSMSYNRAHELLGHTGEATTRATARTLGWFLTPGSGEPCKYCAASQSKRMPPRLVERQVQTNRTVDYFMTSRL